ncbi:MAG: hypothetical protein Fur0028_06560 [Bacteroidales bacterium]
MILLEDIPKTAEFNKRKLYKKITIPNSFITAKKIKYLMERGHFDYNSTSSQKAAQSNKTRLLFHNDLTSKFIPVKLYQMYL